MSTVYLAGTIPVIEPSELAQGVGIQDVVGFAVADGKESKIQIDSDIQAQVDTNTSDISTNTSDIGDLQTDKMDKITPADGYILQSDENGQAESSGKQFQNAPTDSTAYVTTSKYLFDLGDSLKESTGENGYYQVGVINNNLIFNNASAPSLTLGVGTWIVRGYTGMYTSVQDLFSLRLYEGTSAFGGGVVNQTHSGYLLPVSCEGIITITSGTKTINMCGIRNGWSYIIMGSTQVSISCGYMIAYRIK